MNANDFSAPTQPMRAVRRSPLAGLRGAAGRVLDSVAPRVPERQLLVKMGPGRPSLIGDHRTNRVLHAYNPL